MDAPDSKYYFNDFDDRTLRRPLDDETYIYVISDLVDQLWGRLCHRMGRRYWRHSMTDAEFQPLFIDARRSRYRYPDYLDLVGEPSGEDYDDSGELTTQRKAALLLVGAIDWHGLTIGKHQSKFGFNPIDHWTDESRYSHDQKGWYVAIKKNRPGTDRLTVCDYFTPLRNYRCERLHDYLTGHQKFSEVSLRDNNPYNCHPDNIEITSTRGRPKKCVNCERRVTDDTSKILDLSGSRIRLCLVCVADMARRMNSDDGTFI